MGSEVSLILVMGPHVLIWAAANSNQLKGWLADWLADWLPPPLPAWLAASPAACLAGRLPRCLHGWLPPSFCLSATSFYMGGFKFLYVWIITLTSTNGTPEGKGGSALRGEGRR